MKLRRGFVKEAEEISLIFRKEMGICTSEAMCVFKLCSHLGVPLTKLSSIKALGVNAQDLIGDNSTSDTKFFATTLKPNGISEILYNDYLSLVRQHSDIAHEIAHIVLGHESHTIVGEQGCRNYDKVMEREAHDLGYNILIPKLSALYAVENFQTRNEAAQHFGVSKSLLEYRIRKSNATGWAASRRKKLRSF